MLQYICTLDCNDDMQFIFNFNQYNLNFFIEEKIVYMKTIFHVSVFDIKRHIKNCPNIQLIENLRDRAPELIQKLNFL